MVYLNDDTDSLDIGLALKKVSPQRREYALRYRKDSDRRLSLAVYLLLAEGLEKEYGITGPLTFSFGYHGKPYLSLYPDIHFNLSHSGRAAICAIGEGPVGCDIESVGESLDMDLCRRCFNEQEIDSILRSEYPCLAFTQLWTRKEAFLKLSGEGLLDDLPALFDSPGIDRVTFNTCVAPDCSYVYTVCSGPV